MKRWPYWRVKNNAQVNIKNFDVVNIFPSSPLDKWSMISYTSITIITTMKNNIKRKKDITFAGQSREKGNSLF